MSLIAGLVLATFASLALTAVLVRLLGKFHVVDVPVDRSLHSRPVPRGGGLAILGALGVGLLGGGIAGSDHHALGAVWFLVSVVLYGALGFTDDLTSLSARFRIAIQSVVGLLVGLIGCAIGGWHPVWAVFVAAALLVMVNITNFMDGADGVVSLHAVITGTWFTILAVLAGTTTTALFAASLAGAALGFLPFNALRARIFLGDVGSYAIGAAITVIGVVLFANGIPLAAVAAPVVVYLLDTGYTLQLRIRARHRWYEPHKLHVYQRLVSAGWPHRRVNALVSGLTVLVCLATVPLLLDWPMPVRVASATLVFVMAVLYLRLPVWVGAPVPWRLASGR